MDGFISPFANNSVPRKFGDRLQDAHLVPAGVRGLRRRGGDARGDPEGSLVRVVEIQRGRDASVDVW
jgi:hypothetical protein